MNEQEASRYRNLILKNKRAIAISISTPIGRANIQVQVDQEQRQGPREGVANIQGAIQGYG